jgi:hypothetical protein
VSAEVTALQEALAGEHAALFGYGVVGGRSAPADAALARAAYVRHRSRRDALTRLLTALDQRPVPAEAGYRLPFSVDDGAALRRLAVLIEQRCAALYATVVRDSGQARREFGVRAMLDCATEALRWGAAPEPFPGLDWRAGPG